MLRKISLLAIIIVFPLFGEVTTEMTTIEVKTDEDWKAIIQQHPEWVALKNPGKVYFVEIILKNIDKLAFDSEGHRRAYLNKLKAVIATAKTQNWQGVIQKIENDLIPHAKSWLTKENHIIAVELLLKLQKLTYEKRATTLYVCESCIEELFSRMLEEELTCKIKIKFYFKCKWTQKGGLSCEVGITIEWERK